MAPDLSDLELNKPGGTPEPDRSPSRVRLVLAILAILALVATSWFLLWRRPTPQDQDVRVQTEDKVVPPAAGSPVEPETPTDLPPLAETDSIVRQLVGQVSSHPRVAAWLTTDQLIRNFTVVTVNIASGRTPSRQLGRVRPTGDFVVRDTGGKLTIDPRSYRRYDEYADAIAGLDPAGTARLYERLKPRIDDAYRELGLGEGSFDQMLERAFIELLNTPVVDEPIALASKTVSYEYADPRLQSLSSAQRQFLRMGPRNVRMIQAKLREIAPHLGMDLQP
ncbi:MAG TPA: DUF3014 domain-containing protein [Vicinamibacterales bacterium]|nr:DUF3014 domain-containing protein [Vicinamibacterales bacterium]